MRTQILLSTRRYNYIRIVPLLIVYVFVYIYLFYYKLDALDFSVIFVFTYLFVYLYLILNGMNYASLFSLYFISFGVFVGGRFIYVFFNDLFMGGGRI